MLWWWWCTVAMIMQCDDAQWWWLWWFTVMMMMLCDDGLWWWWCTVMMHCDDDNARWWYWICTDLEFSSVRSTLGDSHRPKSEAVYQHWGPENSLGSKKTEVFSTNLKTESCTNSDEFSTKFPSFLITLFCPLNVIHCNVSQCIVTQQRIQKKPNSYVRNTSIKNFLF